MASTSKDPFLQCYNEWITQQDSDLQELLSSGDVDNERRQAFVAKSLQNYTEYSTKRRELSCHDPPALFCTSWLSSLESSLMWLGGCRPSMFIRLVYTVSVSDTEACVAQLLAGGGSAGVSDAGGMTSLSARQMGLVNELQSRTVQAEDRLNARMATMQEDIADIPFMSTDGTHNGAAAAAIERYGRSLLVIMEEADELRAGTARELLTVILTPMQAVELLVAAKQLHLLVLNCGRARDWQHGGR